MSKKITVKVQQSNRPTSSVRASRNKAIEAIRNANRHAENDAYDGEDEVVSAPREVKTWSDAIKQIMRDYDEAWRRLANR